MLAECAFWCAGPWLSECINGEIGGFFLLRREDREVRFLERTKDVEFLDPFQMQFPSRPATELGPALLLRDDNRARFDCDSVAVLKERLDALTKGLVTKLAGVDGLLLAGGCVVHALSGGRSPCSDVDIFLKCDPSEGMSKVRAVYDACRAVGLTLSRNGSLKNMLVTRTCCSVTFFISEKACPPIQVPFAARLAPVGLLV